MAWLTVQEFTDKHITNNARQISTVAISDALSEGQDIIIDKCGEALRTEVANASGETDVKVRKMRRAQDKLAFRAMLLDSGFASRVRDGGIIETEKDVNDSYQNKYESFSRETEARRAALYNEAMEIIEPYFTDEIEAVAEYPPESAAVPVEVY